MCDKRQIAARAAILEQGSALVVRAAFVAAMDALGPNMADTELLLKWLNKHYPL